MGRSGKLSKLRAAELLILIGYMAFLVLLMFKLFGQLDTYHRQIDKAFGVTTLAVPA